MATTCPPEKRCGARFPGWMEGDHPTVAGQIVHKTVFFHMYDNCKTHSVNIQVTKCDSYYVYNLKYPGRCNLRYCGTK